MAIGHQVYMGEEEGPFRCDNCQPYKVNNMMRVIKYCLQNLMAVHTTSYKNIE